MKVSQRLAIEASEKRQAINALLGKETLTDEERAELAKLTGRMQAIEVETRAAIVAEASEESRIRGEFGEGPENRELDALMGRVSAGRIFGAVLEHRSTDGAERELQEHYSLGPNQIPLAMLEERAVTPAPANVGQNQAAIIPGVFPRSVAAFFGVDMPRVGVGEAVYPVLSDNATVHAPAEGAEAAETTGSFSADVLSPSRLQASFFYSREDRARFSGMDGALRQNLSDALSDALDKQIIVGTNGLLTAVNLADHDAAAVTTYAGYRSTLAYGRVDGTYASNVGDIRIVMGSGTYAHAASQFRSANAGDRAALEDLESVTGGVRVSAHVPSVSGNKQEAMIRLGMRRDMISPIWEGVTLIPDEVTKASAGQIVVTAVMLHAVKILRAGGFYKQELQHA